ncbi:hypothetical protein BHE74_00054898, partial [Ensete ventricosum]
NTGDHGLCIRERCYLPLLYDVRCRVYDVPCRWGHHPLFSATPATTVPGTYSHPGLRPRHRSDNLGTCSLQPSSTGRCRSLPSKQMHCQRCASTAHLPADELKSSNSASLLTFTEMPDVINSRQVVVTQELLLWSSPKRRSGRVLL